MRLATTVDNLAETFLEFWELAKDKSVLEQASLWETHYAEPHRAVLNFYEEHYNDLKMSPDRVFARYTDVIPNIHTVSASAGTAITGSVRKCAAALGVAETLGHHIVMVGRFSSNAWADLFGGVPTCFYALELISDLDTLALMAAHETAHTLHHSVSDVPYNGVTVAETSMLEGLATMTSEVVVPGLSGKAYLWPGYETTTAGQKVEAWLVDCAAQQLELNRQLLNDLDKTDPATLGRYFGAGSTYRHAQTPVRAGYAVGYALVRRLCQRYKLSDVARWNRERIGLEIAETLVSRD